MLWVNCDAEGQKVLNAVDLQLNKKNTIFCTNISDWFLNRPEIQHKPGHVHTPER